MVFYYPWGLYISERYDNLQKLVAFVWNSGGVLKLRDSVQYKDFLGKRKIFLWCKWQLLTFFVSIGDETFQNCWNFMKFWKNTKIFSWGSYTEERLKNQKIYSFSPFFFEVS